MNIRRQSVMALWVLSAVVMVIHGQKYNNPPPRYNNRQRDRPRPETRAEIDEFEHYNNIELRENYDKYEDRPDRRRPDRPNMDKLEFYSSGLDKISRMGEGIMLRMQEKFNTASLREMIGYYTRSNSYDEGLDSGCCKDLDFNTFLPGFVLVAVSYMLLFLLNATVTSGRRRRMVTSSKEEEEMLLDGPTWLSMVHELWEQDAALENTACTQETLCRMNRLAMAAPGQAGWAVSLSSLPLSYLLHTRHTGGFSSFMDAALMGRSGANCTELYKSCPRLSY